MELLDPHLDLKQYGACKFQLCEKNGSSGEGYGTISSFKHGAPSIRLTTSSRTMYTFNVVHPGVQDLHHSGHTILVLHQQGLGHLFGLKCNLVLLLWHHTRFFCEHLQ